MSPAAPGRPTTTSRALGSRAEITRLQITFSPPPRSWSSKVTLNEAAPAAARAPGCRSGVNRSSAAGGKRMAKRTRLGPTRVREGAPGVEATEKGRGASRPSRSSRAGSPSRPTAKL